MDKRNAIIKQSIGDGKLALTKLLDSSDGDHVRAYLKSFTDQVLGAGATEAELRDANAKRALVQIISNLKQT